MVALCEHHLHGGIDPADYSEGGWSAYEMREIRSIAEMSADEVADEIRHALAQSSG